MVNYGYCRIDLTEGNVVYDRTNKKLFCPKGVTFDRKKIIMSTHSCIGRYGRKHQIKMFPMIVPISQLEKFIESNMIEKGKK